MAAVFSNSAARLLLYLSLLMIFDFVWCSVNAILQILLHEYFDNPGSAMQHGMALAVTNNDVCRTGMSVCQCAAVGKNARRNYTVRKERASRHAFMTI